MAEAVAFHSVVRTITPVVLPLGLFVGLKKGESIALKPRNRE
jgi:hypothetical protein